MKHPVRANLRPVTKGSMASAVWLSDMAEYFFESRASHIDGNHFAMRTAFYRGCTLHLI